MLPRRNQAENEGKIEFFRDLVLNLTQIRDLLAQPAPEEPPPGLSGVDLMRHRLRTASGCAAYKKRKETVEPVFGIVKAAMGFRRFLLRGLRKVNLEWSIVRLAYNFRRLATLLTAKKGPDCVPTAPQLA